MNQTKYKSAALFAVMFALFSVSTNADMITVEVEAQTHSYNGGNLGTPLDTGVDIGVGDSLMMEATGCWFAGSSNRESDADGLDYWSPTCESDDGFPLYSAGGLSASYGSLVGQIGNGSLFVVGTSFSDIATAAGRLYLWYWDSNSYDNSGSVMVDIHTSVPEPGTLALLGLGLVGMAARRRKTV